MLASLFQGQYFGELSLLDGAPRSAGATAPKPTQLLELMNVLAAALRWDAYPFILLNLMLSSLAALQAPVIMMSQNRQSDKDKALAVNTYQINLKQEIVIDNLRGQTELVQRVAMMERLISSRSS